MSQPPYAPDMAPRYLFLFPKLKKTMKGHFATIDDIKTESLKELKAIPNSEFQKCFKNLKIALAQCRSQGY